MRFFDRLEIFRGGLYFSPTLIVCLSVCVCLCVSVSVCPDHELSFEPALGFLRNLASSVFRAFETQIQSFKKIRVYLLPFAYVFL